MSLSEYKFTTFKGVYFLTKSEITGWTNNGRQTQSAYKWRRWRSLLPLVKVRVGDVVYNRWYKCVSVT